ncbi:MAG: MFS transporter, partial [Promethearchaeota archaeon]
PEKMTKLGLGILFITFFLTAFVRDVLQFLILMLFVSYGVACSRGLLISKITQTVKPNEMGKINGYTTTIDSVSQIAGPITGAFILTLYDPSWLGVFLGLIAVVAFIMFFKKIDPLPLKQGPEYKQV